MKRTILTIAASVAFVSAASAATTFISEFHYDNDGIDTGEFVEVYVEQGTTLTTVTVSLYRDNGSVYDTETADMMAAGATGVDLGGTLYDIYTWAIPSNGIQNGAADGLSVDVGGVLSELLSYEGTLTAAAGAANGVTSTDVGVSQFNATIGSSIERINGGWTSDDDGTNTSGAANVGLTVSPVPEPSSIALLGLGGLALVLRRRR